MLAKMGLDQSSCLEHFDCPPEIIRTILDEDCNGIFVDRICSILDVVSAFNESSVYKKKKKKERERERDNVK